MEINWIAIGIVGVCVIILVVYVIRKNEKDKKILIDKLNNDFKKADEEEVEP